MAEKTYYVGPDQEPKPMEETAFDRESDLQELLTAHPQLLDFLDCFDLDIQALVRRLLDTARRHGATFSGGRWRLSISADCPAWPNPITVGWLTQPGDAGDHPQNANHFVFGIFQLNGIDELPEALSERLRRWASLFHSRGTFVPVADPWNNTNPKDYGFIPCYAVAHADAPQGIDFLTQELASVLDDIAKIE